MEELKNYTNKKTEQKQNSKVFTKRYENQKNNLNQSENYINHKSKNDNKETPNKKFNTLYNSKTKNIIKRTYTKRTGLIQEKLKYLQLTKKNIDDKDHNSNKKKPIRKRIIITDNINENESNDIKYSETVKNNNLFLKSLKNEEDKNEKNPIIKNNIMTFDKYVKKEVPEKIGYSPEIKTIYQKYDSSTYLYKNYKRNNLIDNKKEKYNNTYTFNSDYNFEKDIKEKTKEKKINNMGIMDIDMDMIGYNKGLVYRNKKMKEKLNFDESAKTPKNINSYLFIKEKSKKNNKSIKNKNLLFESKNNIKETKDDYNNDKELFINKEKELNNLYIPKKIHDLLRGSSQRDVHKINKHNYVSSNTTLKNKYKSYKRLTNFSNKNNNNINININNNIKIITYNKKKPYWKIDKKENNIDIIDKNFLDDDKFDIFKDNISDISSIESRSNIESETTEYNNKLNVYLNNIYKTKSIFHPKLYQKKQNDIIMDKGPNNNKYSRNTVNTEKNININNLRNVSVPHFIFKKRITKDISANKNNKSNIKNNKIISNNLNSIKIIKVENNSINSKDNEPKFDELVILNEKLKSIINGIDTNSRIINNLCFDFLNHFNQSSILNIIEKLFMNKNLKIIKNYLQYLLFSVIILYNYCAESPIIEENDKYLIQEIFSFNLQNILYLYEYIISKVKSKNSWANIIKEIIHNYKKQKKIFIHLILIYIINQFLIKLKIIQNISDK